MIYETRPKDFKAEYEIAICFFDCKGEILLLQRQEWDTAPNEWCIPGGMLHERESAHDAVIRETKEETNIDLEKLEPKFLGKICIRNRNGSFISHIFSATLFQKPKVIINSEEHKAYKWTRPEDAHKMNLVLDGVETIQLYEEWSKQRE